MEDLIGLCLSLQSEFSDFPLSPSGTGKVPVHLTAVTGSGERFAGCRREAKAWEQRQLAAPGLQLCSQGSVSGNLALLSGHSSQPWLCCQLTSGSAAAARVRDGLCPEELLVQTGTAGAGHCQQGHRQAMTAPSPPSEPVTKPAQRPLPHAGLVPFHVRTPI